MHRAADMNAGKLLGETDTAAKEVVASFRQR
jgi:hypothetical protein